MLQVIQTQIAYTTWANERLLAALVPVSADELYAPGGASFSSLHATFVHLVNAQRTWLARLCDEATPEMLDAAAFPNGASLHAAWEETDLATRRYVAGLDEGQLAEIVHYTGSSGEPNAYPRWQILVHLVTHAAQHRSEIAMRLTEAGYSPGWFDFLHYLDLRDGTTIHHE